MHTLKTVLLILQYTSAPLMKCMAMTEVNWFDQLLRTSTNTPEGKKKQYYYYVDFKKFFIRKYNPSVPGINTLICIYGGWCLRRLVFEDKLGYEAQYDL